MEKGEAKDRKSVRSLWNMGYISQERFREDWIELNNRMRALRT